MSGLINLNEIEKKAFKSTFQDGLLDIYIGIQLVNFGIFPALVETHLSPSLTALYSLSLSILAIVALIIGKRLITTPRMGIIKFGKKRKSKLKALYLVLVITAIIFIIMLFFTNISGVIAKLPASLFWLSIIFILIFGIGAFFLNVGRFYIWGFFWVFPVPAMYILKKSGYTTGQILPVTTLPGVIICITGILFLVHFLRKNPKPSKEVLHAGN